MTVVNILLLFALLSIGLHGKTWSCFYFPALLKHRLLFGGSPRPQSLLEETGFGNIEVVMSERRPAADDVSTFLYGDYANNNANATSTGC